MIKNTEIIGFFTNVYFPVDVSLEYENEIEKNEEQFRNYIWGKNGISEKLSECTFKLYGNDITLILYQFSIFPDEETIVELRPIEHYRPKEKSIGVPVIITQENFFDKSEQDRKEFLRDVILHKLDLLEDVVKRRKLDTDMALLKADVSKILDNWVG